MARVLITGMSGAGKTTLLDELHDLGQTDAQRAEIAEYVETVEPLLRRSATVELDGRRTPSDLARELPRLLNH